jgi:hypothetical protein
MKIQRDMVHAVNFDSAPEEVQEAAQVHIEAAKRLQQARTQFDKWRVELIEANKQAEETFETLSQAAESWDLSKNLEVI